MAPAESTRPVDLWTGPLARPSRLSAHALTCGWPGDNPGRVAHTPNHRPSAAHKLHRAPPLRWYRITQIPLATTRNPCSLLKSMCSAGRVEAGIFLLGLLKRYPENYARLTLIADSLASFPSMETVDAFDGELRRVHGSSSTRAYLRRVIEALERFPRELASEEIQKLASDPLVGTRFRRRLRSLTGDSYYE